MGGWISGGGGGRVEWERVWGRWEWVWVWESSGSCFVDRSTQHSFNSTYRSFPTAIFPAS